MTTQDLLPLPTKLVIFPTQGESPSALGTIFLAKGESQGEQYSYLRMEYSQKSLRIIHEDGERTKIDGVNNEISSLQVHDPTIEDIDFVCAFDKEMNQFALSAERVEFNGQIFWSIKADVTNPRPMYFDEIARISFGQKSKDYNYCSDQYTVKSKTVVDDSNWEIDLEKDASAGVKDLRMTVSGDYGEGIVRITIDEAPASGQEKSSRFRVPHEPEPRGGTIKGTLENVV